jgi:hypothetical protein
MGVRCLILFGVLCGATATISNQQTNTDTVAQLGANPIRKIVTLLQDMQKEIEAEGVKEKELYDKFMCFCQGGDEELKKAIADADMAIETQTSAEKEQTAEKAGLEQDLIKHKSDRVAAGDDLEKATAIRSKESAEYETDMADQKTNYAAISGAIPSLEKGMGGASLIQSNGPGLKKQIQKALVAAQTVSEMEKKDVMAFLENKGDYAPASGQIVGILKNMKDEMEKTMESLESAETAAVSGYADLKAAKEKEIELASEAVEAKTKRVGELAVSIVQAADAADDATKEKADAEKFLATLTEQCKTKVAEQAARDKTRSEEVSAISEAISILNDDDALDVFKKSVPSALIQSASSTRGARTFGFLQANAATPDRLRRAAGIIDSAKQFHRSHKLALLSYTMHKDLRSVAKSGGAVDFSAITKMIDEMVGVLEAEEKDDEKHKVWCTGELAANVDSTEKATAKSASLDAAISEASDEEATLGEDITTFQAGIAALDKDVAVATEQRKAEHAEYLETIALTEAAMSLVGKAKNRLQKFYNPALYKAPPKVELSAEDKIVSNLGGFVQIKSLGRVQQPEAPETPSGPYAPKTEKSGGVLALMDMLVADLKSSLAEAEHGEKTAQGDYTELMADSQETRASDAKSITDKSSAKAGLGSKIVELKEQKSLTVEELANLAQYSAEVHGSCDFILENFKLRSDARTNEVESLKNAKAVLAGASYSF